jgi:hypothetical protein
MRELGEEFVGSYRYQVHLLHWLESNNYGVFLSDNDLYIEVKRMVYRSDRSDFKAGRNYCAAQPRCFASAATSSNVAALVRNNRS